jgi:hypothetical protein
MKLDKSSKTWMLVLGGIVAVAASAYAAKRIQTYLALREEEEYQENQEKIEEYEDYVHSNGRKRKKWWGGRALSPRN